MSRRLRTAALAVALGALALSSCSSGSAGTGSDGTLTTPTVHVTRAASSTPSSPPASSASRSFSYGGPASEAEAQRAVRRALLPAEVVKEVGFTVKEQPTISKETFFYGCDSALTAEKLLITAGYQELRDSSRTVFQGVSYLPPGGAAGSVNEAPKLTRCASYTLDELVHDQLQVQDLAAVKGFDALFSWCERVDGRQYSCVSVAAKGDLLLQMYSVANTLNDAKVTLGRFLGLSAAQLAG